MLFIELNMFILGATLKVCVRVDGPELLGESHFHANPHLLCSRVKV